MKHQVDHHPGRYEGYCARCGVFERPWWPFGFGICGEPIDVAFWQLQMDLEWSLQYLKDYKVPQLMSAASMKAYHLKYALFRERGWSVKTITVGGETVEFW